MTPTDREILNRIERQPNRAAGYKHRVKEFGLRGGHDRRELDDRLKRLVSRGELIEVNRDRFALPSAAANRNLIAGQLSMHRDGYGFVAPESDAVRDKIEGDIYIPVHEIGAAMHGDRVLVEITSPGGARRAEGRILKIAQRRHRTVVGTFHYGERYNYVDPTDKKVPQVIIIPAGKEVTEAKKPAQTTPH